MKVLSVFFITTILFVSCNKNLAIKEGTISAQKETPIYKVVKTNHKFNIDGKMDEQDWNRAQSINFNNFYKAEKPDDKQKSTFRMMWGENSLYLFYEFQDKYLTARETKRDGVPFFDDCAEIFIIPVPEPLDMHFCFEINLNKAANDLIYFNNYYKGNNIGFKPFNPDYKVEVFYEGTINDNSDIDKGWAMELEIPYQTFGFLADFEPVQKGNRWMFLAIRQERNEVEGERRVTSTIFPIEDFSKDVHQPKEFGFMEFVD